MHRPIRLVSLLSLIAISLLAGVAATPAVLTTPDTPVVVATGNAGELQVSWNRVPGAQHYTIGYANRDDVNRMGAAGRNWLDAFYYVTIDATYAGHTLRGLKPDTAYYVLIGAQTLRFGATDLVWGAWASPVTTAGQHGAGFCPITGLPLPPGGYSSVGDTETFGVKSLAYVDLTLDSATAPTSVQVSEGSTYEAPRGMKLLRLCVTFKNGIGTGDDAYFRTGTHNNLSTDKGIGFARVTGWRDRPIPDGQTRTGCDTWTIPQSATTAVYAIGYSRAGRIPGETLYRIDLSTLSASSSPGAASPPVGVVNVSQRHIDEKRYMLQLINAERTQAGVGTVTLGDNIAAQLHAENARENCFMSHWGLDGLKPYMRYSLAGGFQSNGENGSGLDYCVTAADGYAPNRSIQEEIRETMAGWMNSAGHRRNLLDPHHRKVNIGLAWDRYNTSMVQQFEGDYVAYSQRPTITNGVLSFSGSTKNGAQLSDVLGQQILYDPPPHGLTVGQVARTYCYDNGRMVASLRPPPGIGYRYSTNEFSTTYNPCPSPHDVPANTPVPASVAEARQAWQDAYNASQSRVPQDITVPWITASQWSSSGASFSVQADISSVLARHGRGVYSVMLWGEIDGTATVISHFSIFHGVTPPATYNAANV